MTVVAIDFEASCLPRHGRSFPIEVGIFDGSAPPQSWLILPHADWTGWHWAAEAQALHGIERGELMERGLPAARVMEELVRAVDGRRLVADSAIDQYWLETLAAAAGHVGPPVIDHVALVLDEWRVSADQVTAAQGAADRLQPRRHRAADDAQWLGYVLAELSARVEGYQRVAVAA